MKQKELFRLLDNIQEQGPETEVHERILFIDGLNLFFRNFAVLNMVNPLGIHIGGLGGFFRSLGAMIRQVNPTQVYVVFDGAGSANNRKNIMPEYKSGRDLQRITNWDAFDDKDDEDDAKVDQMVRIIQYLKTLPVKTVSIDKVEADDIIAYLSKTIPQHPKDKAFIVSSDKDFLQLVSDNIVVYRPMEKEYYTPQTVMDKYKISPHNFILHKTLLGDNPDKIKGVKICRQAKSYWNEKFDKRVSPLGKNYYWLTGNFVNLDEGQDTDHWALENDYISVVPIQFDLTAHSYLNNLKSWNFE